MPQPEEFLEPTTDKAARDLGYQRTVIRPREVICIEVAAKMLHKLSERADSAKNKIFLSRLAIIFDQIVERGRDKRKSET
jgi:hypothetical protein